ncbi:MAG: 50S ribosomal protein L4 [Candidatus Nanoarchaeia archaeon]
MKIVNLYSINGEKLADVELPAQFAEPIRPDLISRVVIALQSHQHQPYGADPRAGAKQGKAWPKRRRKFGGTYGKGISRVARKALWHRGEQFGWVGALGAQTVKGVKAYPPEVAKVFAEKINIKEKKKATRSAIAATADRNLVAAKHRIENVRSIPIIIENKFEDLKKAKEIFAVLKKLGLENELERTKEKSIRAGRGKSRGRKYKRKVGPLIIVSKACAAEKSAANIPGVEVVQVKHVNAEQLAPGAKPSRLTVWTQAALDVMQKEKLFI